MMKQSTYEHWKTIIDDQQKSGLGVKAYCKEHGISDKSFYDARRRVGAKESGVKIVPVKLETRRNTTIMINGVPVCVQDDTDSKALAAVVKACMSL